MNDQNNKIIEKIKRDDIKMKPKMYFILKGLLVVLGFIIVFLLSFFIMSLIIFKLQNDGSLLLPGFGLVGMKILFTSFPWVLLILVLLFIAVLETFAGSFKLVYRKPLIYSVILIALLVLLGGMIFAKTPFHNKMGHMVYGREDLKDVYIGKITNVDKESFTIKTKYDQEIIVSSRLANIRVGQWIMIIGQMEDNTLKIKEIRLIKGNTRLYRTRMK